MLKGTSVYTWRQRSESELRGERDQRPGRLRSALRVKMQPAIPMLGLNGVSSSSSRTRWSISVRTRSMTPKAASAPYCVGSICTRNGRLPNRFRRRDLPGSGAITQNASLGIRRARYMNAVGWMLNDFLRVADHSGVANLCATTRESQVSYAGDIECQSLHSREGMQASIRTSLRR
jgi:hypothetical protein